MDQREFQDAGYQNDLLSAAQEMNCHNLGNLIQDDEENNEKDSGEELCAGILRGVFVFFHVRILYIGFIS